jgi:hypothetical protein
VAGAAASGLLLPVEPTPLLLICPAILITCLACSTTVTRFLKMAGFGLICSTQAQATMSASASTGGCSPFVRTLGIRSRKLPRACPMTDPTVLPVQPPQFHHPARLLVLIIAACAAN